MGIFAALIPNVIHAFVVQPSQPKDSTDIQMQHRVEINVEKNIQYDEDQPMTVQFFNGSGKSSTAFASSETS